MNWATDMLGVPKTVVKVRSAPGVRSRAQAAVEVLVVRKRRGSGPITNSSARRPGALRIITKPQVSGLSQRVPETPLLVLGNS